MGGQPWWWGLVGLRSGVLAAAIVVWPRTPALVLPPSAWLSSLPHLPRLYQQDVGVLHAPPGTAPLPLPQEVKHEIDSAIEGAKAAPYPDAPELWTHIYQGGWAAALCVCGGGGGLWGCAWSAWGQCSVWSRVWRGRVWRGGQRRARLACGGARWARASPAVVGRPTSAMPPRPPPHPSPHICSPSGHEDARHRQHALRGAAGVRQHRVVVPRWGGRQ